MNKVNKKRILIALCVLAAATGVWVFSISAQKSEPPQSQEQKVSIPEHVVYGALFHHVVAVKKEADEAQRKGEEASWLRSFFMRQANLSEDHARLLDLIASDCEREVAQQDARAQKIIDAFRASYPVGKIPRGQKLPPPPIELKQMQEERNAMVLHARDRLHTALGEEGFQQFDGFVTKRVASAIQPVPLRGRLADHLDSREQPQQ